MGRETYNKKGDDDDDDDNDDGNEGKKKQKQPTQLGYIVWPFHAKSVNQLVRWLVVSCLLIQNDYKLVSSFHGTS